jgi:ssDNA-binding Zn-finger/Zn-ribbon topoisomerase 1
MGKKALRSYWSKVKEWRETYGVSSHAIDLTKVKIKVKCEKCGKQRKKMHRHHKGHEFLFASLRPDDYARRYVEFRKEDIVILCDKCHKDIHFLYESTIRRLRQATTEAVPTLEQCEEARLSLVSIFNSWINDERKAAKGG